MERKQTYPKVGRPARTFYPFAALEIGECFYDGVYETKKAAKMRMLVQAFYRNNRDKKFSVGNDGEGYLIVKRVA